jgi:hypothetical protein
MNEEHSDARDIRRASPIMFAKGQYTTNCDVTWKVTWKEEASAGRKGGVFMSNEPSMKWPPMFNPADFTKFGKEQTEAISEIQKEFSKLIEQANADWMARIELERDLASELTTKLSSAKTLPDAAKAYQEWMARRMETISKDSQKFFADSQKFVSSMNRFLASGGKGSGT